MLTVAPISTSELEIHSMNRFDNALRYVGIAGLEHQIYNLKANQQGASVGYVNYPVLPGESSGCGAYWYNVARTCVNPSSCSGNYPSRQFSIRSDGEQWFSPNCVTWTLFQQRSVRATVTITYVKSGPNWIPTGVTFQRWEEVYP